ncbi:hypothetical protein HBA91_11725 [Ochrobactrum sp. MR34]|nr:hypothetical protein [Ochrobactrum sp. MR34]
MMEKGFYHPDIGYWQTVGGNPVAEDYMDGTIEVPLKPSDNYVWQNGSWDFLPPAEPTPEEQRALMPSISKRQLRLTLVRNGISLSDLDAAIIAMGDEAVIEWQDASEYRRLHPLLNQVAAHLSLTQEQVDVMWQQALSA